MPELEQHSSKHKYQDGAGVDQEPDIACRFIAGNADQMSDQNRDRDVDDEVDRQSTCRGLDNDHRPDLKVDEQ